jgi:imidazolonepropionase-like amidohydrolase
MERRLNACIIQHHVAEAGRAGRYSRFSGRRLRRTDKGPAYQLLMSSAYLTPLLDTFDAGTCEAVAQRLAQAGVWQVPTLVMWRSWANAGGTPDEQMARRRLFDLTRRVVGIMYNAGVPILAGTDEIPGATVQDELELLVDAGLPPAAALRAATSNAAEFLGVSGSYGSVTPGRAADFVLVTGNPIADIRNLRKIRSVVLHGQRIDTTQIR